jgi:hypothetical protein
MFCVPIGIWRVAVHLAIARRVFVQVVCYCQFASKFGMYIHVEHSSSWEANSFSAIPTFCGTRQFISALTLACHLSLAWARPIQSKPSPYFLKNRFSIILPSTLRSSKTHLRKTPQKYSLESLWRWWSCYVHGSRLTVRYVYGEINRPGEVTALRRWCESHMCIGVHETERVETYRYILIMKPTRCTNFSNLFLE